MFLPFGRLRQLFEIPPMKKLPAIALCALFAFHAAEVHGIK
jgi:hypothetical protein